MILNIIMTISFLPILPIIYYMMINEAEPKKNIVLGVTLPTQEITNPLVLEVIENYKKELRKWTLLLLPILIVPFFIPGFSIGFTIQMLWILLVVLLSFYPFAKYNERLAKIKKEQQWGTTYTNTVVVDMKLVEYKESRSLTFWYLLLNVLTFLPVGYGILCWERNDRFFWNLVVLGTEASITLLCFIFYLFLERLKGEVISENSVRNATITRIRRKAWRESFLAMAGLNTIYVIVTFFYLQETLKSTVSFMLMTMLYTIAIVVICIYCEFKVRKLQHKLSMDEPMDVVVDEDTNWIFGLLYYNPKDKHTLVAKRVGMGSSFNLATKAGKLIGAFVLLALLSIPMVCVWLFFEEYTPISLSIQNNRIISSHLKEEYTILMDDIIEVEYLTALPRASKNVGTGMDNLYKGDFSIKGYGSCEVCLNPKTEGFIVLKTTEETYILSAENTENTKKIYDKLETIVP